MRKFRCNPLHLLQKNLETTGQAESSLKSGQFSALFGDLFGDLFSALFNAYQLEMTTRKWRKRTIRRLTYENETMFMHRRR